MSKIFFILVLMVSSLFSADQIVSREGDIVTVIASGEYIMGDSDNRKEARMMALTQAKINASEVAGTYIESNFESVTKQINGDTVDKVTKQELRSFSAAILQSEITNDTMEMLANKTTVYKVAIKARIDLGTLRERVKQLGEDKAKKDRLMGLEKENKDLSSALEKLSGQMRTLENAKSVKPEEIKVLRDERERLFTKIEKNEGATKVIFEKGSIQSEYEQKIAEVNEAIDFIDNNFIKKMSQHAIIHIDKPEITSEQREYRTNTVDLRKQNDGDYIRVHWSVKIDKDFSNAMVNFFITKDNSFADFQKKRFHSQFKALVEKSKILISLPEITSTWEVTTPIEDGFVKDPNSKRNQDGDEIYCYFDGTKLSFYSNYNYILLNTSDEILKKISEIQAEIVYLPYPRSSLCNHDYDGLSEHEMYSRVIQYSFCSAQLKSEDIIVSINAVPIQSDTDYIRVIQSIKPGNYVNVGIIRNDKKYEFKNIVVVVTE